VAKMDSMALPSVRTGRARVLRFISTSPRFRVIALLTPAVAAVVLLLAVPPVFIFIYSFWTHISAGIDEPALTLENYQYILIQEPFYLKIILDSLWISLQVTIYSLLVGYIPAYVLATRKTPHKTLFLILLMLPFWISFIIRTLSWIYVLGEHGVLNWTLSALQIIDAPLKILYTSNAVLMGFTHAFLPFMILNIYVTIEGIDPSLTDAAKSLGANPLWSFWEVTLPLSLPGISAGCLLVFILTAGSYVTPMILGGPGDIMIAMQIFKKVITALNWPFGSALSILLIAMVLSIVYAFNRFVGLQQLFKAMGAR